MPQRNAKNASFGVFTSNSSFNHLSRDDVQKAYFSTSSERDFYERKLTQEDLSENMIHVHNAGKTYGKYMPYKRNKAPLLDRSSCHYTKEYIQRPMIGLQYNATCQVAASFKPARPRAGKTVTIGDMKSKYVDDYPGQTRSELAAAKPGMIIPDKGGSLEAVLGGKGEMMVKQSHLQTIHSGDFSKWTGDVAAAKGSSGKDHTTLQGYHGGDFQRTSYNREYSGSHRQRQQAVGAAFRTQIEPRVQRSSSSPVV